MKKYSLIIFDLDGVVIDSKKNMSYAWGEVKKKHQIKMGFKKYFQYIGYPFKEILKKMKIKKNHFDIQKTFSKGSLESLDRIRLYRNIRKILLSLIRKKVKIAILTSKDKKRTLKIIKKFNLPFKILACGEENIKGKPSPLQINNLIKMFKVKKSKVVYVGDMKVDFLLTKNAKIDFIFANYGYGKKVKANFKINKPNDILNFV